MKEVITRSLSGIFYIAAFVGSIFAPSYVFGAFILTLNTIAINEGYKLISGKRFSKKTNFLFIIISSLLLGSGIYLVNLNNNIIFPFFILISIGLVIYKSDRIIPKNTELIFLIFYITFPLFLFYQLHSIASGRLPFLLAILILVWVNDTGAYVVGSLTGKHKIFPKISPKKSWEGFIGGVSLTIAASFLIFKINQNYSVTHWMILGLITAIASVLGDLFESQLKRMAHKKDSGKLIPGHGGLLDRIDSFLFVMPVVYFYTEFII